MKTKYILPFLSMLFTILMVSCDTSIASVDDGTKKATNIFGRSGVVEPSEGDYTDDVRVVKVSYEPLLGETVFTCALLGASNERTITVRSSRCYQPTVAVNPNDTITIWANSCDMCANGFNYFYPACQ